jgi:Tfp pilus assembly protein PilF
LGRPAAALVTLGNPREDVLFRPTDRVTMPYVRELVQTLRDSGRSSETPVRLLSLMNQQPAAWATLERGWAMLSQPMQPTPLNAQAMLKLTVPTELEAARQFVVAHLAASQGQPVLARRSLQEAARLDTERAQLWLASAPIDPTPDLDPSNERDLGLFIDEFSDDPEYLGGGILLSLKQGQKQHLLNALHAAVQRKPSNLSAVSQLVSVLSVDEQQVEAIRLIEQTTAHVRSASELYQLSGMMSQAGDAQGAERLLRRAHTADVTHAGTCNDLGYLLADSGRELDFAEDLLNRAVAAEPENPAYIDSLGWLLYKRQKFDQASQYLERALQASEPRDPVVLDHAADAAYRIDQKDKARDHWQQALDAMQQREPTDRQLRLRVDQKLRQVKAGQKVDVAPAGQ